MKYWYTIVTPSRAHWFGFTNKEPEEVREFYKERWPHIEIVEVIQHTA